MCPTEWSNERRGDPWIRVKDSINVEDALIREQVVLQVLILRG